MHNITRFQIISQIIYFPKISLQDIYFTLQPFENQFQINLHPYNFRFKMVHLNQLNKSLPIYLNLRSKSANLFPHFKNKSMFIFKTNFPYKFPF